MPGALWQTFDAVAQARGAAAALIQGDRRVSFLELRQDAASVAARLVAHGVRPGDRCLIWAPNSPELAAAMLGAWLAGAIVALVNDEAPLSHVGHAAVTTQPAVALADESAAERLSRVVDCPVLLLDRQAAATVDLAATGHAHDHEPASIFFTSGSTGAPKGVTQSHANLVAGCRMVAAHLGLRPEDRLVCPVPWAFDYGYGQFLSTVLLGVTQILPAARTPFALCEAIETHSPTIFAALPAILALLVRGVSPIRQTNLDSLRLVTSTGGAISPSIFADVREVFAHCDISLNYGMTETYRSAGLPVGLAASRPESVGFAYPGVALAILTPSGQEAKPGEIGEIVHSGTGVFLGYWGAPEATAAVRRPDPLWRHPGLTPPMAVFTGDLGWKDASGVLTIKGRWDRLIKSMGVRVSPDEIETMIRGTGLVRDAAVVGLKHDILGESVAAAIMPLESHPDPRPALKAFARQEMSKPMQPREYHVLDRFPLTPNGKTDFEGLRILLSDPSRR